MNYQLHFRIAIAFLVAFILTILPLPTSLSGFRPGWVMLVMLYIQFFLPTYFSVIVVLLLGLCLDQLLSTLMGEHMIALVIVTWLASTRVRRFYLLSLAQQMAIITSLSFVYELILYFIDIYQGFNHALITVLGSTLLSLMVWPWGSLLLEYCFYLPTRNCSRWG